MYRRSLFFAFFLSANCVIAADAIYIPVEQRIPNRTDHGVCWWACAEMAGNYLKIPATQGLANRVVTTGGPGWHGGATESSIDHWSRTAGFGVTRNSNGKNPAGIEWLKASVNAGQPVIVNIQGDEHSVLVLGISTKAETWSNATKLVVEPIVTYADPNRHGVNCTLPWSDFEQQWTGSAYVISTSSSNDTPTIQSATAPQAPRPKHVPMHIMQQVYARLETPPPTLSSQAPVQPTNKKAANDNIARPADSLYYGCYDYSTHDYYSQYKASQQKKP